MPKKNRQRGKPQNDRRRCPARRRIINKERSEAGVDYGNEINKIENENEKENIAEIFVETLADSLHSEASGSGSKIDCLVLPQLFRMAAKHHVMPMIYEAVRTRITCDAEKKDEVEKYLRTIRRTVSDQIMRQARATAEFLKLLAFLEERGFHPVAVKGIVCRTLYPYLDHRSSSDEDFFVVPSEFDGCRRAIAEFGLTESTDGGSDEEKNVISFMKSTLHIELHRQLFSPSSRAYGEFNRYFDIDTLADRAERLPVGENSILVPCPTDHLLYLILHSFKHFMHSGFGIRQVSDIVLFARKYGEKVDWDYVFECCNELRADVFAAEIFRIGRVHLGIDVGVSGYPEKWRELETDELPLLADMLESGIYGYGDYFDEARVHSSNITLSAVKAQRRGEIKRGGKGSALRASVFLSAEEMAPKYPYLKRHPWLLPVAWCSRVWSYLTRKKGTNNKNPHKKHGSTASKSLKIGQSRVELMRNYGIID
ncbi:MAG: nucleotidyltransferase family protein [Clostridia bacterium]|nr:nucleotidyltransferase family protein [Clostridia bacterium]